MKTLLTPHPESRRSSMCRLALMALVLIGAQLFTVGAVSASTRDAGTLRFAISAPSASIRTAHSKSSKSKVPLDEPVADKVAFRLASRGCGFTPASALVPSGATTTTVHVPFALGHCRLLEIGDSLGDDLEYGLRHELQFTPGLKLIQRNKVSTGLSASWYYNWPAHLKTDLHKYHPNLVVILFGANDEQALDVNGTSQPFGSPKWRSDYLARVRRIDRLVVKAGAYAFWVGLPIAAPKSYSKGLQTLNAVYREVALSTPGVTFQPIWRLLAKKNGSYRGDAIVNKVPTALRVSDGIHFTEKGDLVIGTFITEQLSTVYNVRLRPEEPAYIDR